MKFASKQQLYTVVLQFANGITRTVQVRAASRQVAENRALKHNPNAEGVKRNA